MINLDETLSKEYLADKIVSNGLDDRLIITPEVNRVLEEVKSFDFRNFLSYDFITKKKEQNNLSEKKDIYARRIVAGFYFESEINCSSFVTDSCIRAYDRTGYAAKAIFKESRDYAWMYRFLGSRVLSFEVSRKRKLDDAFYSAFYITEASMRLISLSRSNSFAYNLIGVDIRKIKKLFEKFKYYAGELKEAAPSIDIKIMKRYSDLLGFKV